MKRLGAGRRPARRIPICPTIVCLLAPAAGGFAQSRQDVIHHLEQTINWYRHVTAAEQMPVVSSDVLLHDSTVQGATEALQLAFDYAHAQAALLSGGEGAGPAQSNNLEQAASRAAGRVTDLENRVAALDGQLAKAPSRSRATLEAQRGALNAELELARQVQQTIQSMLSFTGSSGQAKAGLAGQVDELERAFPEAAHAPKGPQSGGKAKRDATAPPHQTQAATPPAEPFHPESAGILSLATELFAVNSSRGHLDDLLQETDALLHGIERMRAPVVSEIRAAVARSESLVNAAASQDAAQLAAAQKEIESLTSRIKQLSTAALPLGEQGVAVQTSRGELVEARASVMRQYTTIGRYLLLRVAFVAIAILVLLALSGILSRVSFRYIKDQRRRRQFMVLRRILVGCAVFVVVVLGFVSQFGSLATYAGLITAGLAVALQNVILSVVAYFFLIGKYGIRIGDRVTISGVTGKVVDIGLVRIYLMELTGAASDLHATGRIVVFSNSVLFQPAALFKQMPGANYLWHSVQLTLASDSDFHVAEDRMTKAVNGVYEDYRETIERQHAALERSVQVEVSSPRPQTRLRFSAAGLEFTVHYTVELDRASEIDDRMMKALYDAIAAEPRLTLASAGAPKLQETV
ncbi:MAG TPA: mechanosensitive ion channel domain-containing protein [Bryobacteraceae bacterium]|nr:mechanosensitive ion channel domain-containing protein [Bryobacteraceae bacterium]